MDDRALLDCAEGHGRGTLFERHLTMTKEWFPHELVPWSLGRDFVPAVAWDPEESALPDAVRSALFVNLLTEDNLPYYFHAICRLFDRGRRLGRVEPPVDGRGAPSLDRDPRLDDRHPRPLTPSSSSAAGWPRSRPGCPTPRRSTSSALAGPGLRDPPGAGHPDLAPQHRAAARRRQRQRDHEPGGERREPALPLLPGPGHRRPRDRPLQDGAGHRRQVRGFEMPGTGIRDFATHAGAIANAGIYDFAIHHDQILVPVVLRHWRLESIEGLSPEAERREARRSATSRAWPG